MKYFIKCRRCGKLKKETLDIFADSRMDILNLDYCKCEEENKYRFLIKNYERL